MPMGMAAHWVTIRSVVWFSGNRQNGELVAIRISLHELLDDQAGHHWQSLRRALSVVNGALLATVQLKQVAVFFDEGDEVRVDLVLHLGLPLLHRLLMLLADVLVVLEAFADFLWFLPERILAELAEVAALVDKIGILVNGVHDNVKEGDGAACVFGQLLHEEDVFADLVAFQGGCLLLLEALLQLVHLEKEYKT